MIGRDPYDADDDPFEPQPRGSRSRYGSHDGSSDDAYDRSWARQPATGAGPVRDPLRRLTSLLARLPGIGEKSAMRLALALVRSPPEYTRDLADSVANLHELLKLCEVCCDLTPDPICERCRDPKRDHGLICVVAQPQDRMAIERAGVHRGVYHVLHGVLDPLSGVGPSQLQIGALLRRLGDPGPNEPTTGPIEVIVATSPNLEGDATALYLSHLLRPLGVNVSRIASGVAVGGELEYADHTTLSRALEDRRAI